MPRGSRRRWRWWRRAPAIGFALALQSAFAAEPVLDPAKLTNHLPIWPYNLFAMVHGRSRDEVRDKVARIADLIGAAARVHDILFSTRILKKTGLRIAA